MPFPGTGLQGGEFLKIGTGCYEVPGAVLRDLAGSRDIVRNNSPAQQPQVIVTKKRPNQGRRL